MDPTIVTPINESSDITNFVTTKGNGIKGLSKMEHKTLPRQYIQPLEERISVNNIMTLESTPIIDMSNWDEPKAPWTPKATTIHNQGTVSKPPLLVLFQN
ncbi:feruloyl coa ortho-hydroxylase 1 [Quercus suber]|uniref:Feruloyl coa ortho-hydroxylase 1 n=1 Tax=Quercus suber TaxID=58331 RepID=A0AAW0KZ18_QUESU